MPKSNISQEEALALSQARQRIEELNSPVLVTPTDWFLGNDGELYRAAWGQARSVTAQEFNPSLPDEKALFLAVGRGGAEILFPVDRVLSVVVAEECPMRPNVWKASSPDVEES